MTFSKLAALALIAATGVPAAVQAQQAVATTAAPALNAGGKIFGPQGGEVGTIVRIDGGNVVVNTGRNEAALPAASFTAGPNGPMIGFTKQQLDQAIEAANSEAIAALDAALVTGSALRSNDGVALGSVAEVEGDNVTVTLDSGPAMLNRGQFTTDDQGLVLRLSAAELAEALTQAGVDMAEPATSPEADGAATDSETTEG